MHLVDHQNSGKIKITIGLITLIAFLFPTLYYGFELTALGGHPWKTGDWLIHYGDGFIRRGLIGEAAIFIAEATNTNPVFIIGFLQISIYLAVCSLILRMALNHSTPALLIIFFSPAFLLFNVFDAGASFRKELLVFLQYLVLVTSLKRGSSRGILAAGFIYLLAIFSHEIILFYSAFIFYFLYLQIREKGMSTNIRLAFLTTAFSILIFTLFQILFGKNPDPELLCDRIIHLGVQEGICTGAIDWLKYSPAESISTVLNQTHEFGLLESLGIYLVFIFAPLFYFFTPQKLPHFYAFLLISSASMLPLFILAIDWGRWLYIYYVMLAITIFSTSHLEIKKTSSKQAKAIFVICFVYLFSSMPHMLTKIRLFDGGILRLDNQLERLSNP